MSLYVVDASVAVKLYVPEVHSDLVISFFSDDHQLIVPDLMLAEFANIIWKKSLLLGELSEQESISIVDAMLELPIDYVVTSSLLAGGLQIALITKQTLYDSLYIELAVSQGCRLMTDDRKLYNSLKTTQWSRFVALIEDYQKVEDQNAGGQ